MKDERELWIKSIDELQEMRDKVNYEVSQAEQKLSEVVSSYEAIKEKIHSAESKLVQIKNDIAPLREERDKIKIEVDKLYKQQGQLKQDIASKVNEHNKDELERSNKKIELELAVTDQQNRFNAEKAKLSKIEREHDTLHSTVSALKSDEGRLVKSITKLTAQEAELKTWMATTLNRIADNDKKKQGKKTLKQILLGD